MVGELCILCERPVAGSVYRPYCCRECQDEAAELAEAAAADQDAAHLEHTQLREECARLRRQIDSALVAFQAGFDMHQHHRPVDWRWVAAEMAKALA